MRKYILLLISLLSIPASAQIVENINYSTPKTYEIGGININGTKHLNKSALISISGLIVGETIKIPGEEISSAINKLWDQGLFSDISINIEKIVGNLIFLEINLTEYSRLSKFRFKGKIKKSDINT